VDDEPSLRSALQMVLATLGFDTVEASSGEEALSLLHSDGCDVVLLDIEMPGMGGIEACRELRRRHPHLQIIMVTGRDREEYKIEAFGAGADDYVTKPFSVAEFLARLNAGVQTTHRGPHRNGALCGNIGS
jgi:two-component system KDP operon response regulator KdpE